MKIIETIAMLMPILAAVPGLIFGETARDWGLLVVAVALPCAWAYVKSNAKDAVFNVKGIVAVYLFLIAGTDLYGRRDLDSAVFMGLVIMLWMTLILETPKDNV